MIACNSINIYILYMHTYIYNESSHVLIAYRMVGAGNLSSVVRMHESRRTCQKVMSHI